MVICRYGGEAMPGTIGEKTEGTSSFMNENTDTETGMSTDRIEVDNVLAEM
jgi:hypothetical protein